MDGWVGRRVGPTEAGAWGGPGHMRRAAAAHAGLGMAQHVDSY